MNIHKDYSVCVCLCAVFRRGSEDWSLVKQSTDLVCHVCLYYADRKLIYFFRSVRKQQQELNCILVYLSSDALRF